MIGNSSVAHLIKVLQVLPVQLLDGLFELLGFLNKARALVEASLDVPELHVPQLDLQWEGRGRERRHVVLLVADECKVQHDEFCALKSLGATTCTCRSLVLVQCISS